MPASGALARGYQRDAMGREVQSVLDGLLLERDWKISGFVAAFLWLCLDALQHCVLHEETDTSPFHTDVFERWHARLHALTHACTL